MRTAPAILFACALARGAGFPSYTEAGVVNAASNVPGALAPNSIATVYGLDLAYETAQASFTASETLPVVLAGTASRVFIANIAANLFFVSPKQINFLVPSSLRPGVHDFFVTVDGRAGPRIRVTVADAAPAIFVNGGRAAATKQDGSIVSDENPAREGEVISVYATGLGETRPTFPAGRIPATVAPIAKAGLRVGIGDTFLGPASIFYAGLTPGFAGLYQINIRMPAARVRDPAIRIGFGDDLSPEGVRMPHTPPD